MPVDIDLWTESLSRDKKRITNSASTYNSKPKEKKTFSIFIEEQFD
jgi:hypothetical protein